MVLALLGAGNADSSLAQWEYKSIRSLLFAASMVGALVILCLNGFYLWQGYETAIESEKRDARNLVRSVESQTERIFRENEQFLKGIGDLYMSLSTSGFLDDERFHLYLKDKATEYPIVNVLFILDQNGRPLISARVHPVPEKMRDLRAGFMPDVLPQTKEFFLGRLFQARPVSEDGGADQWIMPIFHTMRDASGTLKGYVAAIIDTRIFRDFVSTLEVGEYGDVVIWDGGGRLVAAHPNSRMGVGTYSEMIAERMNSYRSGGYEITIYTILTDIGDSSVVMSTKGVEGAQLGLAAYLNSRDYLEPWYNSLYSLSVITVLVLFVMFGLTISLDRQLKQKELSEEALNAARDQAEDASKAKSQFLAQVSHEFRTPLNAIIGFSEIIKERLYGGAIEQKYVESADNIHSSGDHLLRIVNDLIDLSRAEAGSFSVEISDIQINECVEAVKRLLSKDAEDHGVAILNVCDPPDLYMSIDKHLMEHVLINLVSNAIKFSPPGSEVRVGLDFGEHDTIGVTVTDNGPGMDDSLLERIGEPFIVERAQINVPGRGAGLGLSISKRFVTLMGGEMKVSSAEGQGTKVSLRFPRSIVVNLPCK